MAQFQNKRSSHLHGQLKKVREEEGMREEEIGEGEEEKERREWWERRERREGNYSADGDNG
jgi:hypothetical protein